MQNQPFSRLKNMYLFIYAFIYLYVYLFIYLLLCHFWSFINIKQSCSLNCIIALNNITHPVAKVTQNQIYILLMLSHYQKLKMHQMWELNQETLYYMQSIKKKSSTGFMWPKNSLSFNETLKQLESLLTTWHQTS